MTKYNVFIFGESLSHINIQGHVDKVTVLNFTL